MGLSSVYTASHEIARYNDLLVEHLPLFCHFYPPQSRLKSLQAVPLGSTGYTMVKTSGYCEHRVAACDRQTDRQTDYASSRALAQSATKISVFDYISETIEYAHIITMELTQIGSRMGFRLVGLPVSMTSNHRERP